MKKLITIFLVIAISAIIALIIFSYLRDKKTKSILTAGIVQGTEVNLAPKISGRISELCCKEGDDVQADSIVIRLDNDELRAAVEQAKASVQRANADIQTSEANIESARARLDEAKKQMERTTSLYKEQLVSQSDFDLAAANLDAATAAYSASISQLSSAKARQKEAIAALSLQEAKFNDTVITTPISGIVVFKALETGEFVSPGFTILTVVDMNNLWVRIDIEETLVGYINVGKDVFISIDGLAEKLIKGKISEISRYAEFATQRDVKHGKQDIKTFHVKIKVEYPEKILKPGMTVNVEIPKK